MILVRALAGTTFGTKCPIFGTKLHGEGSKKAACFFVTELLVLSFKHLYHRIQMLVPYSLIYFCDLHYAVESVEICAVPLILAVLI